MTIVRKMYATFIAGAFALSASADASAQRLYDLKVSVSSLDFVSGKIFVRYGMDFGGNGPVGVAHEIVSKATHFEKKKRKNFKFQIDSKKLPEGRPVDGEIVFVPANSLFGEFVVGKIWLKKCLRKLCSSKFTVHLPIKNYGSPEVFTICMKSQHKSKKEFSQSRLYSVCKSSFEQDSTRDKDILRAGFGWKSGTSKLVLNDSLRQRGSKDPMYQLDRISEKKLKNFRDDYVVSEDEFKRITGKNSSFQKRWVKAEKKDKKTRCLASGSPKKSIWCKTKSPIRQKYKTKTNFNSSYLGS